MTAPTKRAGANDAESRLQTIQHAFEIAAPRQRVFDAVSTPDGLAGWWTTKVSGGAPVPGATLEFTFRGPFQPRMRIAAFDPPAKLTLDGVGGHEAWGETELDFDLEDTPDGTLVRFGHHLGPGLSDDRLATVNCNWGYYMDSLRRFCETGRGKPYQPGAAGARVGADPLG